MKSWITYLTATLMGLATTLLLGQFSQYCRLVQSITSVLIQLGGFILIPIVFITFASAVASLRKDRLGAKTAGSTFLWSLLSTIILSLAGTLVFKILPVAFPATSTAGADTGAVVNYISAIRKAVSQSLVPANPFYTLASTQSLLLPVVLTAWLLGFFLKPSNEMIRPAYVVMNSFSEVMYKLSTTFSIYGFAFVFFASSAFFSTLQSEGTVFVAGHFLLVLLVLALAVMLGLLPLLFGIFTGFKDNPYRILYRSLAPLLASLFSANIFFASPITLAVSRKSLGIQKRVASSTIPINIIFSKGGSALVSSFSIIGLVYAASGTIPSIQLLLIIAMGCAVVSFISSAYLGYEVFFITYLTLKILGIDLHEAEMTLVGILPLLCGIGTMIDSYLACLGASVTSLWLETGTQVMYEDIL